MLQDSEMFTVPYRPMPTGDVYMVLTRKLKAKSGRKGVVSRFLLAFVVAVTVAFSPFIFSIVKFLDQSCF